MIKTQIRCCLGYKLCDKLWYELASRLCNPIYDKIVDDIRVPLMNQLVTDLTNKLEREYENTRHISI